MAEVEKLVKLARNRRRPVMVRSLDAIHLASALVCKARTVVATDTRLRAVATWVQLKVEP